MKKKMKKGMKISIKNIDKERLIEIKVGKP